MFFVLLSVWFTRREGGSDWASGAAFGAAMCIKMLPLIVLPVLFFCRPGLRRKSDFSGLSRGCHDRLLVAVSFPRSRGAS